MTLQIQDIYIKAITVTEDRREAHADAVANLKSSIQRIGLKTPITIRLTEVVDNDGDVISDDFLLVTGRHRLKACEELGWETIPAIVIPADASNAEVEARLWYLSENLHRADLTVLERSEMTAEWLDLTAQGAAPETTVAADAFQVETHQPKKAGQKAGGINDAARKLGIDKSTAHRAKKISKISPEAKTKVKELGFDDNQSALLKISAAVPEEQVAVVEKMADEKSTASELTAQQWMHQMSSLIAKGKPEWKSAFPNLFMPTEWPKYLEKTPEDELLNELRRRYAEGGQGLRIIPYTLPVDEEVAT